MVRQWVHDYDFVKLHQPSVVYGVQSKKLEGNWMASLLLRRMLPWEHRASKSEILHYFGSVLGKWTDAGSVQFFGACSYQFSSPPDQEGAHTFTSLDGLRRYSVRVRHKLVNGVNGECIIPARSPLPVPVSSGVSMITVNELVQQPVRAHGEEQQRYVVLGAGKTGMGAPFALAHAPLMRVHPGALLNHCLPRNSEKERSSFSSSRAPSAHNYP